MIQPILQPLNIEFLGWPLYVSFPQEWTEDQRVVRAGSIRKELNDLRDLYRQALKDG